MTAPRARIPDAVPGPVRHHRIDGDAGVVIAAVEVGPASAPTWLIAHGAGSSARFVVEAFGAPVLATGARLVTYDLRGHGASGPVRDRAGHHLDRQVADLLAVAGSVPGPVEVVGGVSLGAHAAVRALARRGARDGRGPLPGPVPGPLADVEVALACMPAWTGPSVAGTGPHAGNAAEARRVGIPAVIDRLRADTRMPRWLKATLLEDHPRHDPASLIATLEALDGGAAPDEDELRALPVPLAVVGWPDDPGHPLAVAQRWAASGSTRPVVRLRLRDLDDGLDVLGRRAAEAVSACRD